MSEENTMVIDAATSPLVGDSETAPVIEQDLLVEDVSIDGMCGVY
jgi:mycofactocin precursor